MYHMHDIRSEQLRLLNVFDRLPEGWDAEYHPAYDDLERDYAELRMHPFNH
jgi:hypothetical protein